MIPPLSELLGADRYYEHTPAIVGQGTITANHGGGHFWNGHESLQHVAMNTTNFVADPMQDWSIESVSGSSIVTPRGSPSCSGGVRSPKIRSAFNAASPTAPT